MALTALHNNQLFGVGDTVSVIQKIKDGEKTRTQSFIGMVIGIKGEGKNKSFTVRRIGAQNIGIERIFPLFSPSISEIEKIRDGGSGIRSAKLYFTRNKPKKEIEKIYVRAKRKNLVKRSKIKTSNASKKK